jgi:hypothetical protein
MERGEWARTEEQLPNPLIIILIGLLSTLMCFLLVQSSVKVDKQEQQHCVICPISCLTEDGVKIALGDFC